jgi:hypothetical protein
MSPVGSFKLWTGTRNSVSPVIRRIQIIVASCRFVVMHWLLSSRRPQTKMARTRGAGHVGVSAENW